MLERLARRCPGVLIATTVAALLFAAPAANAFPFGVLTVTYVGCSGLTVAPDPVATGNYVVVVNDSDNCAAAFSLTGPGVNLSSDLSPAGPFGPYNFQAGATYTARDSNSSASATFTPTADESSSSTSSTSSGSSTSGVAGTASSSSQSSSSRAVLGILAGSISAAGKATLTIDGSTVKKLKAGVYKLIVSDHSKKAGLIIQPLGYAASSVSGVSGTGTRMWLLRLIPGRYFFQATGGPKTYFAAD